SGENATLKRKLDETETRLAWARMERDYDCVIRYHPGKANVVADTLNRKDKELIRVRALVVT
ncbi:hypothetical protein Tco_0649297, partial [Tanacetum coccineum]